ncbi:MAG TPA: 2-dehydropantoate 2-reductase [Opitutales bacterium]|nr:2-dehydropantoate 2-reductase [Opitutales bacterium]
MKIAIVGAGAVGGYYGARLARAGEEVHFLLRSDYAVVRARGWKVTDHEGSWTLHPAHAHDRPETIGTCDCVIIAAKATANPALRPLAQPLLGENSMLLSLQNGLGNVEFHAGYAGAEKVLGGLAFVCINRVAPGVIEKYIAGSVRIGEFSGPARERTHDLAARFMRAGVDCAAVDSLVAAQWRKLVWNVPFNGLAIAAGGVTTDVILSRPDLREQVLPLMQEVRVGAAALGVAIPESFLLRQIEVTEPMGAYKPSSLVDYLARREVEVEAIWGEPVRRARGTGVELPRLEALYGKLKQLCRG